MNSANPANAMGESLIRDVQDTLLAGQVILPDAFGDTPFGVPAVVLPPGYELQSLGDQLSAPRRITQQITCETLDSFLAYVKRFKTANTVIFASEQHPSFMAVIDYHGPEVAAWGSHTVKYPCPTTLQWNTWTKANKAQMSQAQFAQFIEDNLPDIIDPVQADMLQISRSLEAKKSVEFASSLRLDNGEVQFKYNETIQGSVQQGAMKVPERFRIGVAVFQGDTVYSHEARLRYRIENGGSLKMWFDLFRPEDTVLAAAQALRKRIEELSLPVYVAKISD